LSDYASRAMRLTAVALFEQAVDSFQPAAFAEACFACGFKPQTLQSPEECEQKGEENSGWVIFHAWQA
jgi:hypothetical protein